MSKEEFVDHIPLTEEEALGLLPKGKYKAYIQKVEVKQGKKDASKKYLVAYIDISHGGRNYFLNQYLFKSYLLKHMYDATDNSEKYKNSKLSTKDCEGYEVEVLVSQSKPTDDHPGIKNTIEDFYKLNKEPDFFNDQITFK